MIEEVPSIERMPTQREPLLSPFPVYECFRSDAQFLSFLLFAPEM